MIFTLVWENVRFKPVRTLLARLGRVPVKVQLRFVAADGLPFFMPVPLVPGDTYVTNGS